MPTAVKDHPLTGTKLTPKQAGFVKEYVRNGGNGTQAVLKTYDTNNANIAHSIASENLRKPTIKEEIEEAARSLQLTPRRLLGRLDKGLDNENPMAMVACARTLIDMTGWKSPDRQEITHKVGNDEHSALGNYIDV